MRSARVSGAIVVLFIGVALAWLFRKPADEASKALDPAPSLVLRRDYGSSEAASRPLATASAPTASASTRLLGSIEVAPLDGAASAVPPAASEKVVAGPVTPLPATTSTPEAAASELRLRTVQRLPLVDAPPPALPDAMPAAVARQDMQHADPQPLRHKPAAAQVAGPPQTVDWVRHKVRDGDTLPLLAERYLGGGEGFRLIYEANRDVLKSPDVLPLGIELKIPVPTAGSAGTLTTDRAVEPAQPMVPIDNSLWRRRAP